MSTTALSPLERFHELCEKDPSLRFEFDGERIIELAGATIVHAMVAGEIVRSLKNLVDQLKADLVVPPGMGFELLPQVHRIPDVSVLDKSTAARLERRRGWYVGAPLLAIEIVSPNDNANDLDLEVRQYLKAGVRSAWVVYPETRHVLVYRAGGVEDYREDAALAEPELFGAATIDVADFFADLPAE